MLIPILLFFLFTSIHAYQKIKKDISDREITLKEDFVMIQDFNYLRTFPNKNFSSGRIELKQILDKIDGNNVIYGFGPRAEYLINQSASNALIYAYASSGIIGLMFLVLFLTTGYKINKNNSL